VGWIFGPKRSNRKRLGVSSRVCAPKQGLRAAKLEPSVWRQCRMEPLERRELLSVQPIELGVVYFEAATELDESGDIFHVTFLGGAPGTRLTELRIDTDKLGDGLTIGDALFDTHLGGTGAFGAAPFIILEKNGIDSVIAAVEDGGTLLRLTFTGFDPGETLVFSIDVDEMGFRGPNAVVEGNEFEGSILTASFEAPHYYPASQSARFWDDFDPLLRSTSLELPPDNYVPPGDVPRPVHTAGGFIVLEQIPLPVAIAGTVFEDKNLDGRRGVEEPGIPGVQIQLWRWESDRYVFTGQSQTADSEGRYRFEGLLPGTYQIVELQPAGWFSVAALPGSVADQTRGEAQGTDAIISVSLLGGEVSENNDFAEVRPVSLSGFVYHDANDNGWFDSIEQGIADVTVRAEYLGPLPTESSIYTAVTLGDGSFHFAGLMPGSYRLVETQPGGYLDGRDRSGSAGGLVDDASDTIAPIWLASGESGVDYWFGELMPASISGRVFADRNQNCRLDDGEIVLPGVTIWLLDTQGNRLRSTTTDARGFYRFDRLPPGTYGVEEVQPAGFFDGPERVGSAGGIIQVPDTIRSIELRSGTTGTDYDFCEWESASLSGTVYEDDNNDGIKNSQERGIPGVILTLVDELTGDVVATTVTNSAGAYQFSNLVPFRSYQILETQPSGYLDGIDTPGTAGGTADQSGDRIHQIELLPAVDGRGYNFGELQPASIAGRVFTDRDGNCRLDAGEHPLAGVTIWLLDSSGRRIASTRTDSEGNYRFENLPPGVYGLEEIQPAGFFDGPECIGTAGGWLQGTDRIVGIKLAPGTQATRYNFKEWEPARLSGYVFRDGPSVLSLTGSPLEVLSDNRDGMRTPDDRPIPGVILQLTDAQGRPILGADGQPLRAITDSSGYYEFVNLPPGVYCVFQVHPEGFVDWIDTPGLLGGTAVNPGQPVDPAILEELLVDPRNDAILNIHLRPGDIGTEYNFSEIEVTPLLFPADPPIRETQILVVQPLYLSERVYLAPVYSVEAPPVWRFGPGAGFLEGRTWHLSIVNAGQPRQTSGGTSEMKVASTAGSPTAWSETKMDEGRWEIADSTTGKALRRIQFGLSQAIPLVGDFNGDGKAELAVYQDGIWFIDLNGNGQWDDGDLWIRLGSQADTPVVGDWDGDGKTDIGIFGPAWPGDDQAIAHEPGLPDFANATRGIPKNIPPEVDNAARGWRTLQLTSRGPLRSDLIDHVFAFGHEGHIPVTGDWNGDGVTNIGLFRDGNWWLDTNGNGRWDAEDSIVSFGQPGDRPVVGDWNGDGIDDLGVWRGGVFVMDNDGNRRLTAVDRVFQLGGPQDVPLAGDFNGDGIDDLVVYRPINQPQTSHKVAAFSGSGDPPGQHEGGSTGGVANTAGAILR